MSAPISTLPASGGTGVEQSANRALEWFERAQLATDPLIELLYLFFALEAILGDTSEGLKGEQLASISTPVTSRCGDENSSYSKLLAV